MGPDRWAVERLSEALHDHPGVVDALQVVTALGKPQVLAVASVVAGVVLLARRRVRAAAFGVVATIGAWLVDNGLKDLVDRARPDLAEPVASASGPSFPSGHAMTSAAAYGALVVIVLPLVPPARRRLVVAAAAVVVVAVGITRVALGVHWPTDVLGGWAFGLAWLAASAAVLRPTPSCGRSGPRR